MADSKKKIKKIIIGILSVLLVLVVIGLMTVNSL
jgi:flagellar basal body-associated protein FliL